jgi:hypothetical protein
LADVANSVDLEFAGLQVQMDQERGRWKKSSASAEVYIETSWGVAALRFSTLVNFHRLRALATWLGPFDAAFLSPRVRRR